MELNPNTQAQEERLRAFILLIKLIAVETPAHGRVFTLMKNKVKR